MTTFKSIWIEHKKFGGLYEKSRSANCEQRRIPKVDVTEPTREDHSNTVYSQS